MSNQTRREFLRDVGAGIAGVAFGASLTGCAGSGLSQILPRGMRGAERRGPQPNILLIVTDDQRWDALSCMGRPVLRTPELDALASDGVLFSNNFATTAICCSSRASLLTGTYVSRNGVTKFQQPFQPGMLEISYPVQLRRAGYRTGFVGKWGLADVEHAPELFDFWAGQYDPDPYLHEVSGKTRHLTELWCDDALRFIRNSAPEQPFCLSVNFKAPHIGRGDPRPFQPELDLLDVYEDAVIEKPASANEAAFAALPALLRESESRTRWVPCFSTEELFQQTVKDYYRLVTGVDRAVGRMRAALAEKGLANNTIIIFTSDNGFFFGEHGLSGKWFMYEEFIRTPLIVYDPRQPEKNRSRRVAQMTLNIDVAPSILEFADVALPDKMQGESFVALLDRSMRPWRSEFYYEHPFPAEGFPRCEGVRTERWKYARYDAQDPAAPSAIEQLFDLTLDPLELKNLAGEAKLSDRLDQMRHKCSIWREQVK